MDTRLTQIIENFTKNVMKKFAQEEILTLDEMERELGEDSSCFIRESLAAYAEMIDQLLLAQKRERKEAGVVVHKRGVTREYLCKFGKVEFERSYFKTEEGYSYLTDKVVGLESYERVSRSLSAELVDRAAIMSYQKSANETTKGEVTKQTVMNKIRQTKGLELMPKGIKKKIKVLYVLADEDHVAMQNGKNVIVPLITVHEGIEKVSKGRNRCKNARHFCEYGKPSDVLWEEVGAWVQEQYDTGYISRIYLHGDGGKWIRKGMEVLPECRFVLDKYHLEKSIKTVTAGFMRGYSFKVRKAIHRYDLNEFEAAVEDMLAEVESTNQAEKIMKFRTYILNNWDGIKIRKDEPECGSSCTEAQISHVLAERLSRVPLGWSDEGLKYMSKLRVFKVNGETVSNKNFVKRNESIGLSEMEKRVVRMVKEIFDTAKDYSIFEKQKVSLGGKVTPINVIFKGVNRAGYAF
jgi:hypothetical protein